MSTLEAPPLQFGRLEVLSAATPFTATVIVADGGCTAASADDVAAIIRARRFTWVDLCGGTDDDRAPYLSALRLEPADVAWLQRSGQDGELSIERDRLRAVTWLWRGRGAGWSEAHLLGAPCGIVTAWSGDAHVLDDIRAHFAQRLGELERSPFEAAAILLQLLLSTLNHAMTELDAALQEVQSKVRRGACPIDFARFEAQLPRLQSSWSALDRYLSEVETAMIGVEALPGVDAAAARELNDYADQVGRLEHRMHERSRWSVDLIQDYAAGIAQRQSEQISRLTLVAIIFMPLTFLTGFFGMNFRWLVEVTAGRSAFLALGVGLPIIAVIGTLVWLRRRGLI